MTGALYLPWMSGVLEEHLGEGYWLSFNQRLPISYKVGDCLYGLLHCGQLLRDKEDAEGELVEDTMEEECYVWIPKESGRGWERKVRGSGACLADSY